MEIYMQEIYQGCLWHQQVGVRAGEESEGSGTGQREELNRAEVSTKFFQFYVELWSWDELICPVLRPKEWIFTLPHSYLDASCPQEA